MLEILTGTGLASAAGINAYIPLLAAGLIGRYTDLLGFGAGWQWLENPLVLGLLGVLLAVEIAADKIPIVDSVNDAVQTLVRPTSGGITFAAGTSAFGGADLAAANSGDASWWPIITGVVIALVFHGIKSVSRLVLTAATAGAGGPVASVVEDTASTVLSVLSILVPFLIALLVPLMVVLGIWAWRRRRGSERDAARVDG